MMRDYGYEFGYRMSDSLMDYKVFFGSSHDENNK